VTAAVSAHRPTTRPRGAQPGDQRIGLLGGSFDPVHIAHVALAQTARHALSLNAVQLIPAAAPWQRAPLTATPQQRLDMLALALDGIAGLSVNPIELHRGGPSYTIDTVRALTHSNPACHYTWILGADQLQNFCTWRDWQQIIEYVDLAVASRPGLTIAAPPALQNQLDTQGRTLHRLPFAERPISASAIRQQLATGLTTATSLTALAPAVLAYIQTHRLYQSPSSP